uniref:Subtilisin n=2 Tax=Macrostomum lignano TaxID=282301 RepID=A0A1I8GQ68_9PLAT
RRKSDNNDRRRTAGRRLRADSEICRPPVAASVRQGGASVWGDPFGRPAASSGLRCSFSGLLRWCRCVWPLAIRFRVPAAFVRVPAAFVRVPVAVVRAPAGIVRVPAAVVSVVRNFRPAWTRTQAQLIPVCQHRPVILVPGDHGRVVAGLYHKADGLSRPPGRDCRCVQLEVQHVCSDEAVLLCAFGDRHVRTGDLSPDFDERQVYRNDARTGSRVELHFERLAFNEHSFYAAASALVADDVRWLWSHKPLISSVWIKSSSADCLQSFSLSLSNSQCFAASLKRSANCWADSVDSCRWDMNLDRIVSLPSAGEQIPDGPDRGKEMLRTASSLQAVALALLCLSSLLLTPSCSGFRLGRNDEAVEVAGDSLSAADAEAEIKAPWWPRRIPAEKSHHRWRPPAAASIKRAARHPFVAQAWCWWAATVRSVMPVELASMISSSNAQPRHIASKSADHKAQKSVPRSRPKSCWRQAEQPVVVDHHVLNALLSHKGATAKVQGGGRAQRLQALNVIEHRIFGELKPFSRAIQQLVKTEQIGLPPTKQGLNIRLCPEVDGPVWIDCSAAGQSLTIAVEHQLRVGDEVQQAGYFGCGRQPPVASDRRQHGVGHVVLELCDLRHLDCIFWSDQQIILTLLKPMRAAVQTAAAMTHRCGDGNRIMPV